EDAGARNVEDADRQDQQADENKETDAQFRPRQLLALRHAEAPPCLRASLLHRTSAAIADFSLAAAAAPIPPDPAPKREPTCTLYRIRGRFLRGVHHNFATRHN